MNRAASMRQLLLFFKSKVKGKVNMNEGVQMQIICFDCGRLS